MSRAARSASTSRSPTTPAATAIARSARARRRRRGWPTARPSSCQSLLPRRLHPAGADRRHRLPEQGGDLRHPLQGGRRDLITIAADPKHLGARIGLTAVLHTWGPTLPHHPHVHCIVPGGGLSPDGERWISCRPGFFLPVRVLSRLFRRLFLEPLAAAIRAAASLLRQSRPARRAPGLRRLARALAQDRMGRLCQAALRRAGGGARLSRRYTHRVAIANSRLIAFDDNAVTFRWKDYRA